MRRRWLLALFICVSIESNSPYRLLCDADPLRKEVRDQLRICTELDYAFCLNLDQHFDRKLILSTTDLTMSLRELSDLERLALTYDRQLLREFLKLTSIEKRPPINGGCYYAWRLARCSEVFRVNGKTQDSSPIVICKETCDVFHASCAFDFSRNETLSMVESCKHPDTASKCNDYQKATCVYCDEKERAEEMERKALFVRETSISSHHEPNLRLCTFFLLVTVVLVALSSYEEFENKNKN